MENQSSTDFGVVQFVPCESFQNPDKGLSQEARLARLLDLFDTPPRPPGVGDWPRVHTAIFRSGMFVIETATPSFTAMLRFHPQQPQAGDYEIHHRPRGGIERGRTLKLKEVPEGETDGRVSMLAPFKIRYFIVTGADDRARTQLVWLVGLRDYRTVEPDETAA